MRVSLVSKIYIYLFIGVMGRYKMEESGKAEMGMTERWRDDGACI